MSKIVDFFKPNSVQNNQQNFQNVGDFGVPNQAPQQYNQNPQQQYGLAPQNQSQQQYNGYQSYNPLQQQINNQPQNMSQQNSQVNDIQTYQQNLINNNRLRNNQYHQFENQQIQNYNPNQNYIQQSGYYPEQYNNYQNNRINPANYRQDYLDFERRNVNDNYQNYYQNEASYPRKYFDPYNHNYLSNGYVNENSKPVNFDNYNGFNNQMQYGYNEFSNINQFHNGQNMYYNSNQNYANATANNYNPYKEQNSYKKRFREANIIPREIGKEIKSEKLRVFLLFAVGLAGIIMTSLMLAVYYKTDDTITKYIGLKKEDVMYPFFSILLLIISLGFFGISLADFTLLFSNVKRYERDLMMGNESIPYFITRNYKSLISRSIYINWICFSTYIFGSIILGILYTLQTQAGKTAYIFFWTIGTLKTLESEITVNIIILLVALFIHVVNIISTRNRKNNIISYYGYEIIPEHEIKAIKKRANKICIILFCVIILLILFVILIPWLIIRRKKGQSLKPWKFGRQ